MNLIDANLREFLDKAAVDFKQSGFRVVLHSDRNYDRAKEISNSRFESLSPHAVAYPRTAEHVAACVKFCKDNKFELRTRSGGHHHEGMSSANDVLMVRMTEINGVEYIFDKHDNATCAWIGVGTPLNDVYNNLQRYGKILPGGGCAGVHIGGITQGGGWGMSARNYGLLCDTAEEFELVNAKGEIKKLDKESPGDIFWALKGGGGGNFGIVTRIKFKLKDLGDFGTTVSAGWKRGKMQQVIDAWIKLNPDFPKKLTTVLRISVTDGEERDDAVVFSGRYYGNQAGLEPLLKLFLAAVPPDDGPTYRESQYLSPGASLDKREELPPLFTEYDISHSVSKSLPGEGQGPDCKLPSIPPPNTTCNAPHPHKVTSTFPREGEDAHISKRVAEYVTQKSKYDPNVRKYMAFHQMGGKISDRAASRAFPWGKKPYMLQIQAWWNYPPVTGNWNFDKERRACVNGEWDRAQVKWVKDFRKYLEPHVEGAFINFVDAELGPDPSTPQGRVDLLEYYYGKNMNKLIKAKAKADAENFFRFQMSIPTHTP